MWHLQCGNSVKKRGYSHRIMRDFPSMRFRRARRGFMPSRFPPRGNCSLSVNSVLNVDSFCRDLVYVLVVRQDEQCLRWLVVPKISTAGSLEAHNIAPVGLTECCNEKQVKCTASFEYGTKHAPSKTSLRFLPKILEDCEEKIPETFTSRHLDR